MKAGLTRVAESELTWDRKEDFIEERHTEGNQNRMEDKRKLTTPHPDSDPASQLFHQSLPATVCD